VVWPTAATPLAGPVLDQVDFGVDEDANLLWAVDAGAQPVYRYQASTEVPPFWHPYLVDRVVAAAGWSRAAWPTCPARTPG
jgi:hypothetical protein